jgi:hypothetical protein
VAGLEASSSFGHLGSDPLADVLLADDEDDDGQLSTSTVMLVGKTEEGNSNDQLLMTSQPMTDEKQTTVATLLEDDSFPGTVLSTAISPLSPTATPTTTTVMQTVTKDHLTNSSAMQTTLTMALQNKTAAMPPTTLPLSLSSIYPQQPTTWAAADSSFQSSPPAGNIEANHSANGTVGEAVDLRARLEELLDHNTRLVDLLRTSLQIQYSLFSRILSHILP